MNHSSKEYLMDLLSKKIDDLRERIGKLEYDLDFAKGQAARGKTARERTMGEDGRRRFGPPLKAAQNELSKATSALAELLAVNT